jgi:hypothetical protein
MAHRGGQDVAPVGAVPRRLGQPQRLDVVPLGQAGLTRVDGHVPGQLGESGHRGEQRPPGVLPVGARQQPGDHAVEVVHHHRADVPAAEAVVQLDQHLGGGPDRLHVRVADPGPAGPCDLVVGAGDQPVPAGLDQGRGGDRGTGQEVAAADVAAPQLARLFDRTGKSGREVQPDARGEVLAVRHADLVDGDLASQLASDRLRDHRGRLAARLLPPQPAGDRGLVVAQVQRVFRAAEVDPAGQAGVGAAGLLDQ